MDQAQKQWKIFRGNRLKKIGKTLIPRNEAAEEGYGEQKRQSDIPKILPDSVNSILRFQTLLYDREQSNPSKFPNLKFRRIHRNAV